MRLLTNLSRVTVFNACAIWFMTRAPGVHAKLQNCNKFNTENGIEVCNSCCGSHPAANDWTDGTNEGAGIQVLETQHASCGSPTTSCPSGTQYTGCGSEPWLQAVESPSCCLPSGYPCNQGTCCHGLICLSNNSCGTCRAVGQACGKNSDCCNNNCSGGTCTNPPPPCDGHCPADECMGPANYSEYPTTGCPTNARNSGGWCCNAQTPIVVDVDGSGFDLTSLEDGVHFDIADVGAKPLVSWTSAHSTNAWLALDRNGNGTIDSGAELFGNATSQPDPPSGKERNGFLALAVFDKPENGGNGNGLIDDGDPVYDKLLLWQDLNHDGVSQGSELKHLRDFGIAAIALSYRESRKEDQFGNLFRYRSQSIAHVVYLMIGGLTT